MKLEQQVISLESARRLKELGVKQESLFYWQHPWEDYCGKPPMILRWNTEKFIIVDYERMDLQTNPYSAFTVAELISLLPPQIPINDGSWWSLVIEPKFTGSFVGYVLKEKIFQYFDKDSLSDSLSEMLIYLIENKLIELK